MTEFTAAMIMTYSGGGSGDDLLSGGDDSESDTLNGGSGSDLFIFNGTRQFGDDIIEDFEAGIDLIRISGLIFSDLIFTIQSQGVLVETSQGSIFIEGSDLVTPKQDDLLFI